MSTLMASPAAPAVASSPTASPCFSFISCRQSSRLQFSSFLLGERHSMLNLGVRLTKQPYRSSLNARSCSATASPTATPSKASNSKNRQERFKKFSELIEDVIHTTIDSGPKGALRLAQGIEAVVTTGGEWLIEQSRSFQSPWASGPELHVSWPGPSQLRRLFERLGATYIKLGQFIASTPSLFPAEYVKEFQSCLDKTPPVPFDQIKAIIKEDLGRPLEDVYDYVNPVPMASASIAQVHGARLKGSLNDVVIKVLKPGVGDILMADLNFLYIAARVLEFLNPQLSRTSLVGIVGDIRASMLEEVDFQKEVINIELFRNYLETAGLTDQATAPQVYRHCSARRVLTMERLYGVPLTDLNSIRSLVANPEGTLITALNVWFGSLLACETFHADVHAGNLLVLRDGRIGFIDFGIVGRISRATWAAIETFLDSIGNGQFNAMAAALIQMGAADAKIDASSFARDLEKVFMAVQDLDSDILITATGGPRSATVAATLAVDEQRINALLLDVIRVSEDYGLRFPREFGILVKQLLYFDQYTRLLAPNLKVLEDERIVISSDRRDEYNRYRY